MKSRHILISGCSIAGLTCAYWLRRYGFTVTIVEIAEAPRSGGQAVDLRGAGRTVIERMGLLDEARMRSLDQEGIAWVDEHGRIRASMAADAFGGEGFVSEIEILRGDLVELLQASVDGVDCLFDDSIVELSQDAEGVDVVFLSGRRQRFDYVIGADGLHSTVRSLAFAEEADVVEPLGLCIAWFAAPAFADCQGWYHNYNRRGGLAASIRPGRRPGESKAALSFRVRSGEGAGIDRHDRQGQLALLRERFDGAGWHTEDLLPAASNAEDFAFDELGQVRMDRWWQDRCALIGDAAAAPSPLSGLGTSVALVGAYVLAGQLARCHDPRLAGRIYDRLVRPYAVESQELPGGGAGFAPRSDLGIWLMRTSMRLAGRWPLRDLLARQFAKSADIVLPDYSDCRVVDG